MPQTSYRNPATAKQGSRSLPGSSEPKHLREWHLACYTSAVRCILSLGLAHALQACTRATMQKRSLEPEWINSQITEHKVILECFGAIGQCSSEGQNLRTMIFWTEQKISWARGRTDGSRRTGSPRHPNPPGWSTLMNRLWAIPRLRTANIETWNASCQHLPIQDIPVF